MLNQLLLLADEATNTNASSWQSYVLLGVLVVFFIGMMIFSSRSQKKRQQKVKDMIDKLSVGNEIKTIGGFIGTIIEVCPDNTFVIETGSATKKSYMKIDKSAIYATTDSATTTETVPADKQEVYNEVVKDEEQQDENK